MEYFITASLSNYFSSFFFYFYHLSNYWMNRVDIRVSTITPRRGYCGPGDSRGRGENAAYAAWTWQWWRPIADRRPLGRRRWIIKCFFFIFLIFFYKYNQFSQFLLHTSTSALQFHNQIFISLDLFARYARPIQFIFILV